MLVDEMLPLFGTRHDSNWLKTVHRKFKELIDTFSKARMLVFCGFIVVEETGVPGGNHRPWTVPMDW